MEHVGLNVYITDGLRALSDSVAGAFGGSSLTARWFDVLTGSEIEDVDSEAQSIKSRIKRKLQ